MPPPVSDEQKAAALVVLQACGGNVREAARKTGFSPRALSRWLAQSADVQEALASDKKKRAATALADKLEEIAWKLADAVPEVIENADLQKRATALAIVIDKMQLLRGAPNNISQQEHNVSGRVELATVESYRDWLASRGESKG